MKYSSTPLEANSQRHVMLTPVMCHPLTHVVRISIIIALALPSLPFALAGCGSDGRPPSPQAEVKPEQPDPKLAEFQAGMKKFIEEARVFVRADWATSEKRIASVEEAYYRIPDPPVGNTALEGCREAAKQITSNFRTWSPRYIEEVKRNIVLGDDRAASAYGTEYHKFLDKQKAYLNDLEAAVNEGRSPKPVGSTPLD